MVEKSCLERLPTLETVLPRHQFLRVAEFETLRKNFRVGHPAKAGQARPDLRRDRMVPVAMPAQDQLGLLPGFSRFGMGRYG
jgi:hypothetical protein